VLSHALVEKALGLRAWHSPSESCPDWRHGHGADLLGFSVAGMGFRQTPAVLEIREV
jgi:hypothetical protein